MNDLSTTGAALMVLAGTAASVGFTLFWGMGNAHPVRHRREVRGRAAAPYWHSPTGLQDERGITARGPGAR
jgi:hypothetical protein